MKGRRQARRAALQGLYELDLSDHPYPVVLAGRRAALSESALDSMLATPYRALSRRVAAVWDGRHLDEAAVAGLAERLGEPPAAVEEVARALNQLVPQLDYLERLMAGVVRHRELLDETIQGIAPEWPVAQMAPVDRNVLRIALWEIGTDSSPTRVAISEAVELARAFSGEGARRMVNGALGTHAASGRRLVLDEPAPEAGG
jgi:N utilization substance protein B